MSEVGADNIPFKFKISRVIDSLRDGATFSRYYHREAIPRELADKLITKLDSKGRLNYKDGGLLLDFERSQLYGKYKVDGRVLNIASGFDGLPQSVYGEENTVMLSRDSQKYFSPYEQYAHNITKSPKVEADMRKIPFANNSFSTVLLNGFESLDTEFLQEISRSLISGGVFIMTARNMEGIDKKFIDSLVNYGFRIKENGRGVLLRDLVLEKI